MGTTERPQNLGNMPPVRFPEQPGHLARSRCQGAPFEAANLLVPRVPAPIFEKTVIEPRQPRFLPQPRYYRFQWKDLVEELFSFYPLHLRNISVDLFRQVPLLPRRFAARPIAASLILHLAAIPLLPLLLVVIPKKQVVDDASQFNRNSVVYYRVAKFGPLPKIPARSPFGPGSSPGVGNPLQQESTKGATRTLSALFVVSRPHIPDNNYQTILQPHTPSDFKIKNDLKLPNLVLPQLPPPKPRMHYISNDVRPMQPKQLETRTNSPKLPDTDSAQLLKGLAILPEEHPRLAVPLGSSSAPIVPSKEKGSDVGIAPTFVNVPSYSQGLSGIAVSRERLAAPVGIARAPTLPAASGKGADLDSSPIFETNAGNGQGLVVLSTDPAPPAEVVALPQGNRNGSFTVATAAWGPGAPRVISGSATQGGVGGTGPDGSAGDGRGTFGGGGSSTNASGFVSLPGNAEGAMLSDPGPAAAAQMVYPLPITALIRHNMLVVSAGPTGGGGSNVYGELPCAKIYTVFLPTGGKQWSLQFCQKTNEISASGNRTRTTVVHAESPLLPPEARESYDFKRFPLPPEKAHKSIILRGAISEDGKVEWVEVHQGLSPSLDAAARLAFSQWKFKPAMQSGKPIRVEVLVAIPGDQLKPGLTH
jgi:Gram-negative bacterial TonB protein C-terminal